MIAYLITTLHILIIDFALSIDNVLFLIILAQEVPIEKRQKIMTIGILMAVILRILLGFFMFQLLEVPYIRLLGGIFLLGITIKSIYNGYPSEMKMSPPNLSSPSLASPQNTIWVLCKIALVDVFLGVDNVLAIIAASEMNQVLAALGVLISLPMMLLGSRIILYLFKRYPSLFSIGITALLLSSIQIMYQEPFIQNIHFLEQQKIIFYILSGIICFTISEWRRKYF